jgi:hypothetical protein
MGKRSWSILVAGSLIASVFSLAPARAQEAPTIPAVVQIDDPFGDANTQSGDVVGPADASTVADIGKVWFTNTATTITVNMQSEAPPPASATGVLYSVTASPGKGSVSEQTGGCLRFMAIVPGANAGGTYQGPEQAKLVDRCNDGDNFYSNGVEGELSIATLDGGNGLVSMTFPREYSALLADGAVLTGPAGRTDNVVGGEETGYAGGRVDDTKVGTDYTITGDEPPTTEPPVIDEPDPTAGPDDPSADDPPKKDCKKIKNKKKRKKCKKRQAQQPPAPEPEPEACPAYVPGEKGAEAETTVVTAAATEEAPVELALNPGPAIGLFSGELAPGVENPLITHAFQNVQVDTDGEPLGLYVRIEFAEGEDQDLYLLNADDSTAARAAGGNQAPEVLGDGTGTGGHSEATAEQLDGVLTPDCGGYTIDDVNAFGFGETVLKLWLGPATWDPVAQAAIGGGR